MKTHHNISALVPTVLAVLAVLVMALPFGPALAGQVTVDWVEGDANATIRDRAGALASGFRSAVYLEALDLLPVSLNEARRPMLREYLAPGAGSYVVSYSETANSSQDDRRSLSLDVKVNRTALKTALKRLGVYYTASGAWDYDLRLSGDAGWAWADIGRLQTFTGVRVVDGADPSLVLSAGEGGVWSGTLTAGDQSWTENGDGLDMVWHSLWARFFDRPQIEARLVRPVALEVSGWGAADGARAFDVVLRSWEAEVEGAELGDVVFRPEGVRARWTIKTLDVDALRVRLDAYLPGRGLEYELRP